MAEIKKLRRIATAGTVQFDGSVNVVKLTELTDGGPFDLHPFATETDDGAGARIYFPSDSSPGYGVAIEGDLSSLGRVARAILALERKGTDAVQEPADSVA